MHAARAEDPADLITVGDGYIYPLPNRVGIGRRADRSSPVCRGPTGPSRKYCRTTALGTAGGIAAIGVLALSEQRWGSRVR